jgi:ABC-type uncharacterized transport system ATPase subunit
VTTTPRLALPYTLAQQAQKEITHAAALMGSKPTVFDALTVFENLELALKAPRGPFACLRWVLGSTARARIEEVCQATWESGPAAT